MKNNAFYIPFDVIARSVEFGTSLRIARLRRRMTQGDVALRVGVGREVIANAEKGKSVSSHTLFALLWLYGLLGQAIDSVSNDKDVIGMSHEKSMLPQRIRKNVTDDEF